MYGNLIKKDVSIKNEMKQLEYKNTNNETISL